MIKMSVFNKIRGLYFVFTLVVMWLVISEVYKSRTCSGALSCIMNQQDAVHSEKCAALSVDSDNVIVVICTL